MIPDVARLSKWLARLKPRLFRRGKSVDDVLHREHRTLEIALILIVVGIMCVLQLMPRHWTIFLNLYFLPVALAGFYLGRYRAGVMSTLCVLSATLVAVIHAAFGDGQSLLLSMLIISVWGAVLGLTSMLVGTLSDERARRYQEVCASHQSDTLSDPLTAIANRRAFEQELDSRLAHWQQHDAPFALVLVDIDHFKRFNDTYGHQAGDKVLHDVARSLESTVRDADLVARYGGEEFVVLLPGLSLDEAQTTTERIRSEIEVSRYFYERLKLRVTVSLGLAWVQAGDDAAAIIQRADEALYASKQAGRNCAHFHSGEKCEHFGAPLTRHQQIDRENHYARRSEASDPYCDGTTGLPSRRVLLEELNRRAAEARRYQASMSLMLVQLDNHDDVKELGRQAEEKVISVMADTIRSLMRDADLVVRYAPDQFAVMMPFTSQQDARRPAERLRTQVASCASVKHNGTPLAIRVSVGLAEMSPLDDTPSVLAQAMTALEEAVQSGGDCAMLIEQGCPRRIEVSFS